ncbi:MAG: hypothetical protein CMJ83_22995 [Planctomycetes bacterium]|nr:hypothetical protein [Planctomycetota bacterium]
MMPPLPGQALKMRLEGIGGEHPSFVCTVPSKAMAPRVTGPGKISGRSTAVEIGDWSVIAEVVEAAVR